MNTQFFRTYILPGITFQSIVISGGYCTGQEIVQYFLSLGPVNGFYGLLLTTVVWSIICALCFLLAKAYQAYDYKTFFKVLLGRWWFLFEICYLYLVLIALSVIAASVGSMLQDLMGIPYTLGLLFPFAYILIMVFKGSKSIEKMFSFWSLLLYVVFVAFLVCCYQQANVSFLPKTYHLPTGIDWFKNGIAYASYNLGCIPAILFTLSCFKTNRQAVISGILAGPLASIPGVLLFFALSTKYPDVLTTIVPSTYMLEQLAIPLLTFSFAIILIGTLVETGVGLVHAFNERIRLSLQPKIGQKFNYWQLALILLLLLGSFGLSQYGLVNLIIQGYGLLTWFMLGVFIFPLLSIGLFKIKMKF
jgi:uncharacterized membrane protein YkvI